MKFINATGDIVAEALVNLFKAGSVQPNFEIVGFSFGAQFSGNAARKVKLLSGGNFSIKRVVGIEPAIELSPIENLGPDDAEFVMTIHTGNVFSNPSVIGHVGFFVNGGEKQPMCTAKTFLLFFNIGKETFRKLEVLFDI